MAVAKQRQHISSDLERPQVLGLFKNVQMQGAQKTEP